MTNPAPGLFTILGLAVTALRATSGYSAPTVGTGTVVYDGPWTGGDAPVNYVCIGWTPSGDEAGTFTTQAAHFGSRADVLEEGTFDCTIVVTSGDEDAMGTLRTTAQTILADLQAAVYGLTSATFDGYWCQVSGASLLPSQTTGGLTLHAVVSFSYRVQLN